MRIAVVGGGPAGLYFSALMKRLDPAHEVTVWERNAPGDTFGFGVVFSDETLGGIENADPAFYASMAQRFARWTDIDIHLDGVRHTVGGQGFAAMSRHALLSLLQQRCAVLGVDLRFRTPAPDPLPGGYDLVIAADGVHSQVRARYFEPSLDVRGNRYIWLGTDLVFEAFQFFVKHTRWGTMVVHGYPYAADGSTFIAEMTEDVWRAAGLDNDPDSVGRLSALFADELDGHDLISNNSRWLTFTTVRNTSWTSGNVVLLGDAAHTAHFSIGSGTKLAMEDALALAACLHENGSLDAALKAYETERRPVVESTQRAAQASMEWFEDIGRYRRQDPIAFCFNLLTRSRRITYDNLRERDPEFARRVHDSDVPPMFQPFRLGPLELRNRIVVSAMDMYSAADGVPDDFHLVHLGSKALGGAALVMTEMVCVSPTGRITPGCTGIWNATQTSAWQRIVAFAHARSGALIGVQLGHSGRKGSTRLMWEGIDEPLPSGGWDVVGPSPLPYGPGSLLPRALTVEEMDAIRAEFVAAAVNAATAGFDVLELHCAHGYLLSSFLSPVANKRDDEYGGSLENRLRYPLSVFDAVREVWPSDRALLVRISATDWVPDGNSAADAVRIAAAFAEHGAHGIDVSTGQVTGDEKPAYGRTYQTPFADRIRHETGAAVIAVGAISSYDDVNSLLLAGRADLCALGRAHLYDPQWTLHAAAEQGYDGPGAPWPVQFRAGSRKPPRARTDAVRPRLSLLRDESPPDPVHVRWRPAV